MHWVGCWWDVVRQLAEPGARLSPLIPFFKQDPDQKKKDPEGTGEDDEHVPISSCVVSRARWKESSPLPVLRQSGQPTQHC